MEKLDKILLYFGISILVLALFDFIMLALAVSIIGFIILTIEILDNKATKLDEEKHKKEWKEYLEKESRGK